MPNFIQTVTPGRVYGRCDDVTVTKIKRKGEEYYLLTLRNDCFRKFAPKLRANFGLTEDRVYFVANEEGYKLYQTGHEPYTARSKVQAKRFVRPLVTGNYELKWDKDANLYFVEA